MLARLAIALPAVAMLGVATAAAIDMGLPDDVIYRASQEISTWRVQPGDETVASVRDELEGAAAASPRDPAIQELLGILATRSVNRPGHQEQAIGHFRKALALRPGSPYTWANLADARYRIGDTGREFELALRTAAALGPAEPEVQRIVADFGLAVFDEMQPDTQVAIDRMVMAGVKRNPLEMLSIAQRRGRLALACRHLDDRRRTDPKWFHPCEGTEAIS